jgi:DNA polymerase III delta prime subunit
MKISDLPMDLTSFRLKPIPGSAEITEECPILSISPASAHPEVFDIFLADSTVQAKPNNVHDFMSISQSLSQGNAYLAEVRNPAADSSFDIRIAVFNEPLIQMGDIEVSADHYAQRSFKKIKGIDAGGINLHSHLKTCFTLKHNDDEYLILQGGPVLEDVLKEDEENPHAEAKLATYKNSFCSIGDGIRFVATRNQKPDGSQFFFMSKMSAQRNSNIKTLKLAKANLEFKDVAGEIKTMAHAEMTALTQDPGSYMKTWDKYCDLEGEALLEKCRSIGYISYEDPYPNHDEKLEVKIKADQQCLNQLKKKKNNFPDLTFSHSKPEYLENSKMSYQEFADSIKDIGNQRDFSVFDFIPATNILILDSNNKSDLDDLPHFGGLVMSFAGDLKQIERRESARNRIRKGESANPQLGLLIEDQGKITTLRKPPKVKALTAYVRNKIFTYKPTPKQENAIRVALNTPDIALIQGPPGTGKTTVIAAIVERLQEEADKRGENIKGQIELTSYQHAAVENMIDRIKPNDLPAIPKIGQRRVGEDTYTFNVWEGKLRDWCDEIAQEIRRKNPQLSFSNKAIELKLLTQQYLTLPSNQLAESLLNEVSILNSELVGENVIREANALKKKLEHWNSLDFQHSKDRRLLSARQLRHYANSFEDDGPARAKDALIKCEDILEPNEESVLKEASQWKPEKGEPHFLPELFKIKNRLLQSLTAPPIFSRPKINSKILDLVEKAGQILSEARNTIEDKKTAALNDFLDQLENNTARVAQSIQDYSFAYASTCQQSASYKMADAKGTRTTTNAPDSPQIEFEYVIVDEAARVGPLDLMISMAMGKKIILVGDHRQLPHFVEDDIVKSIEAGRPEGSKEQIEDLLKKSFFEYMFTDRLKKIEKADEIPRTVTLDQQFRMHPLLGNFISENFYRRHDPREAFTSNEDADFSHYLPGTNNKPAAWLDVPVEKGRCQGNGSLYRPAEIHSIKETLNHWFNSEQGKGLSYGIISPYKKQADTIAEQVKDLGIPSKYLKVGTVDAFQGMEFDVVFLSLVRNFNENRAQYPFGFLEFEYRINVAMSRQKRLLVVVGDSGLVNNKIASEKIPGLVNFYQLVQDQGVFLS